MPYGETLVDLQEQQPEGWTLIGAQMVALHGMEHNRMPSRLSQDADVLANVRAIQDATRRLSQALVRRGVEGERPPPAPRSPPLTAPPRTTPPPSPPPPPAPPP